MIKVSAAEFQRKSLTILIHVTERKETVLLTRYNHPVAILRPIEKDEEHLMGEELVTYERRLRRERLKRREEPRPSSKKPKEGEKEDLEDDSLREAE